MNSKTTSKQHNDKRQDARKGQQPERGFGGHRQKNRPSQDRREAERKSPSKKYPPNHRVEGNLRITGRGLGLVAVDGMEDMIEIDTANLHTALDGDRVEVLLYGKEAGRRPTGTVTAVLLRFKMSFAGIIDVIANTSFLIPDDTRMYKPILIPSEFLMGAKKGDKVFGQITEWTDGMKDPLGKVLRILGKPGDNDAEMFAIVLEKGFMPNHAPEVEAAALSIDGTISDAEIKKRRDFRSVLTMTIDPWDAKDFDDALSIKMLQNGNVEVGIHIADVSHYVTPGSVIDKEAVGRATSVYLVDRTIPMLPERLSNDLCSLVPNKDRLTMSAVFELNKKAEIVSEWFGKTIIHSARRFTYEEAQAVIETGTGDHAAEITVLNELAKTLRDERTKHGAIAFEAEEVKFKLDEEGRPLSVYIKEMKDSNKLIEEFMLLANKRVATFLSKQDPRTEKAFLYRVHDVPKEERMQDLSEFLSSLGIPFERSKATGEWDSRDINKMLTAVQGRAEAAMIQIATVRSMAKAVYTTKNIGHYGLAFEYYTHFTSPIRRYPDLMVHRLLQAEITGQKIPDEMLKRHEELARWCSQMEKDATEAERASIRLKQCEYFAVRIGTAIEGTISGVTEWGIYIEDNVTKAEGMIHIKELPNDFFFFEEKKYRLVGKNTGVVFRLGDRVRAEVTAVDMKKKQLTMKLLGHDTATISTEAGTERNRGNERAGDRKPTMRHPHPKRTRATHNDTNNKKRR
ncbi:MAG TPA: ribonuclease R [Candidatus Paceibacterota bacterium]|nr:ribonuclease R [Candidatus Paceibacterota bacterium]